MLYSLDTPRPLFIDRESIGPCWRMPIPDDVGHDVLEYLIQLRFQLLRRKIGLTNTLERVERNHPDLQNLP